MKKLVFVAWTALLIALICPYVRAYQINDISGYVSSESESSVWETIPEEESKEVEEIIEETEDTEEIAEVTEEVVEETEEVIEETCPVDVDDYDIDAMISINPDVRGVIEIPCLDICYTFVQGDTLDEYQSLDWTGASSKSGSIYMDPDATVDSAILWLFGHNMANGSMFGSLDHLEWDGGADSVEENPYIIIYTEDDIKVYEIISFGKVSAGYTMYNYSGDTDSEGYEEFVNAAIDASIYETEADIDELIEEQPQLLALSTCYGAAGTHTQYFTVVAAQVY